MDTDKFSSLFDYTWHPMAIKFLMSDAATRVIITGNQAGKTATAMMDLQLRLLSMHPVPKRNNINKPIRCISKCLPKSNEDDEENAQYTEFKRRFPLEMIRKDVTSRVPMATITDLSGAEKKVEFLSKNMDLDALMSVQRSAYYQDEEIEKVKWDECQMRMLTTGGDTVLTMTPVKGIDWTYDNVWLQAKTIYRSESICKKFNLPPVERNPRGRNIEIFCWATDDNPIMKSEDVDRIMSEVGADDDDDTMAMRRFGVFRQVSGLIYKSFDKNILGIERDRYYDPLRFSNYWHYRIIDFHPTKPWYVSFVAIAPNQEWFVWNELILRHDNFTTRELRDEIRHQSLVDEDCELNRLTLIDPLANVKQPNSGFSVMQDLGRGEDGLHRIQSADTKNEQGRMNIRHRIKNSVSCGVPYNNQQRKEIDPRYGAYLPTLWIMDNCQNHITHLKNWRTRDWKTDEAKAVHDDRRITQKYSDFCRNLEFLGALDPVWYPQDAYDYDEIPAQLFNGRRRVA